MNRLPPQTPADMLKRYGAKVETCVIGILDAMLVSLMPEGEDGDVEEFRRKHSVAIEAEIVGSGMFYAICVRDKQVGYVHYQDGVIDAEMDLGPFL